jgi:hypothetical protein
VQNCLPPDLLSKLTILLQDSGYVTIKPKKLKKDDWIRINEKVQQMGGLWISSERLSHWSIPYTQEKRINEKRIDYSQSVN